MCIMHGNKKKRGDQCFLKCNQRIVTQTTWPHKQERMEILAKDHLKNKTVYRLSKSYTL